MWTGDELLNAALVVFLVTDGFKEQFCVCCVSDASLSVQDLPKKLANLIDLEESEVAEDMMAVLIEA